MVRTSNRRSKSQLRPLRRSGRRERRAVAVRSAILRAAAGVFRDRGFADTGMRDIAEAADISTANLYYYFGSKADILYFCQQHSLDRMLEQAAALERARLGPAERLRRMIAAHLLCTLDELDGAAAHTEVDALPPALRRRIVSRRDRYERALRRMVAAGMRRRVFVRGDPALLTRAILGAVNWTARWYRPGGRMAPQQVAQAYADYLVRGLGA
ncbi:MAG TPA: TetR/AcrR family transcriptional regulator [Gemmatimonadales bacterium]|nr:TetR/AcrR family transcriptional regulator [Gemmatimonadales bacterium]